MLFWLSFFLNQEIKKTLCSDVQPPLQHSKLVVFWFGVVNWFNLWSVIAHKWYIYYIVLYYIYCIILYIYIDPPPLAYTVYALENIDYYHEPNLTWTKCYPVSLPRGWGGVWVSRKPFPSQCFLFEIFLKYV